MVVECLFVVYVITVYLVGFHVRIDKTDSSKSK